MIDFAIAMLLQSECGIQACPSTELQGLRVQSTPSASVITIQGLPRVTYTQIDDRRGYTDDGAIGILFAVYQLDIYADLVTGARAIADRICDELDGYNGTVAVSNTQTLKIERIWFPGSGRFDRVPVAAGANQAPARFIRTLNVHFRDPQTITP